MNRIAKLLAVFAVSALAATASAQTLTELYTCSSTYYEVMPAFTLDPGWCVAFTADCGVDTAVVGLGLQPYFDFGGGPVPVLTAPGLRQQWNGNVSQSSAVVSICNNSDTTDCPPCGAGEGEGEGEGEADSDTVGGGGPGSSCPQTQQDCTDRGVSYIIQASNYCIPLGCEGAVRAQDALSQAISYEFHRVDEMPVAADGIGRRK